MTASVDLPEGPVTIMFTDIEGSTALRTSLGDSETNKLFREHDELVRVQIEEHNGRDQKAALGDGFLAVFASTRRALACAIAIERALDSWNLNRVGPALRVRIGLNTGEVAWQESQLSGEAVHAASRVCAEGSGGQILVSDVTRQLAGTIPDVTFHDTGEHQLKGFPEPWRLWEVVWVRETTQLPQQVFVGRDQEMATLRAKLIATLEGSGGLVLVGGEPGVGKTTLVRQLIREAEKRGALAVFGRCYESQGSVPYSPFVEMLEQALAIMPAEIVREDMGDDAPEVARMVPELRRRFPDIGDPLDLPPEQQRRYFFNAVSSFVARGSARFPLMLVMDDVHWADEPTLLLIEHMAARMPEMRILGIGTYRDVELEVARPLAATIERLVRSRIVERLSLKRFDHDRVGVMLESLAGKVPPIAIVDAVFDETEGNPFFVEEVFRHLVEDGKLLDENGEFRSDLKVEELDVPESVRLVIGRRLERLGPEAQRVLAAGATVGRAFPFSLLEEVTDVDSDDLVDIVEQAELAKVIVPEERDGAVHYSFAHELIRQTLMSSLSVLRRQRLHLAVANALERTGKDTRPSEIAHHLLHAGAGADPARTLDYLERSAERAMDAAAYEEALKAVEDAISVVDPNDTARLAKLMERKGWAVRALGHFDECIAIWEEVLPLYQQLGDDDAIGLLTFEIGYQHLWLSRFPEAFTIYQRGLGMIADHKTPAGAMLLGAIGAMLGLAGVYDASEDQFTEAERIADEVGDDRVHGHVQWGRTISHWSNARIAESIASGSAAVDHLRRAGDLWTLIDALAWTSFPLVMCGRVTEGRALAEEGIELARKLGHQTGEIMCKRGLMLSLGAQGIALDDWEERGRWDLERFSATKSPWVAQSHTWLSVVLLYRGDLEGSLEQAELAIVYEPTSAWSGCGWGFKIQNRAIAGDLDTVRAMLDEERDGFPAPGVISTMGKVVMVVQAAQAVAIAGLADEAEFLYERVAAYAALYPASVFDLALTHRVAGMTAACSQRWDDAMRHFEHALHQANEFPNRLDRPIVLHFFGKALLDRGLPEDRDRGLTFVNEALAEYERVGMPLHADLARAVLG